MTGPRGGTSKTVLDCNGLTGSTVTVDRMGVPDGCALVVSSPEGSVIVSVSDERLVELRDLLTDVIEGRQW